MENNKLNINNSDEDDELKKLAPTLFNLEKNNDFIVPEGYFDNLSYKIQELCNKKTEKKIVISWQQILKPQFAIISLTIIISMFVVFYIFYNKNNISSKNNIYLSKSENYNLDSILTWFELDEPQIVEVLYTNNKTPLAILNNNNFQDSAIITINHDKEVTAIDIVEYLLDEEMDESEILAMNN